MKILPLTLLTFAMLGDVYAASETTHMTGRENKVPGAPGYTQVKDDDKAMDVALRNARRTIGFFFSALQAKKTEDRSFQIKKAFVDGANIEHIWIGHLSFDGHVFHGRINNHPRDVKNIHFGEDVTVDPGEVSDWMFVKDGLLMGGYTTRVLYARLSAEDKAIFNKEANFKIE